MSPSPSLRWPRSRGSPSASGEPARGNGSPAAAPAGCRQGWRGRELRGPAPHPGGSVPCGGVGCRAGEGLTVPWPCREHLEEEQLLDGRYRLQEMPGGHVALPVLEEKLSRLRLPREMPCGLVRIQVGRDPPPFPESYHGAAGSQPHMPHPSRRTPSPPGQPAGRRPPRSCGTSCGGCWVRAGRRSWSVTCPVPGSGTGIWSC